VAETDGANRERLEERDSSKLAGASPRTYRETDPASRLAERVGDLRAATSVLRVLGSTVSCWLGAPTLAIGLRTSSGWSLLPRWGLDGDAAVRLLEAADREAAHRLVGRIRERHDLDLPRPLAPVAFARLGWGDGRLALVLWPARSLAAGDDADDEGGSSLESLENFTLAAARELQIREQSSGEAIDQQVAESAQRRLHALHHVERVLGEIQERAAELEAEIWTEEPSRAALRTIQSLVEESSAALAASRIAARPSTDRRRLGRLLAAAMTSETARLRGHRITFYGDEALLELEVDECLGSVFLWALEAELVRPAAPIGVWLGHDKGHLTLLIAEDRDRATRPMDHHADSGRRARITGRSEPVCVAKHIIESLGGTLEIECHRASQHAVCVALPLDPRESPEDPQADEDGPDMPEGSR